MRAWLTGKVVLLVLGVVAFGASVVMDWFTVQVAMDPSFGGAGSETPTPVGFTMILGPVVFAVGVIALISLVATGRSGLLDPVGRAALGVAAGTIAMLVATTIKLPSSVLGYNIDESAFDLTVTFEPGIFLAYLAVLLPTAALLLPARRVIVEEETGPGKQAPVDSSGDVIDLSVRGL